jgi:hypothetical protein
MEHPHKIDSSASDGTTNDRRGNDGRSNDRLSNDRRSNDRRREPRIRADISLMVWGVDSRGERFLQEVRARDISLSGALLSGLDSELRSGDVIGILYAGKQARYRVVWVGHSGSPRKVQAAVHRFALDQCPWKELLEKEQADAAAAMSQPTEATRED